MTSADLKEAATKREQAKPEFARHARQNRSQRADGNVHKVKRQIGTSRLQEGAAVTQIELPKQKRWMRASALPQLPPPPGFHIEYVRKDDQHRGDQANLVKHLQEGWEFARKSDFPGAIVPTARLTDHGDCIGNASSILMKIDLSMKAQRDAFYRARRNAATKAVGQKNPAPEGVSHPSMPIVEDVNRSQTQMQKSRVRRAPVRVAPDV